MSTSAAYWISTLVYFAMTSQTLGTNSLSQHNDNDNMFRDRDVVQDKKHIQQHFEGVDMDMNNMSPQEVEFHYFNIHDLDASGSLDGLEIMKALEHSLYHSEQLDKGSDILDPNTESGRQAMANIHKHIVSMVDNILDEDDKDKDGYLSYAEFSGGRRSQSLGSWWWSSS